MRVDFRPLRGDISAIIVAEGTLSKGILHSACADTLTCRIARKRAVVAIRPKPAFQPLFEIANTREDSDVVLINEPPLTSDQPEAADSCFWWRRGRDEAQQHVSLEAALRGWKAIPATGEG